MKRSVESRGAGWLSRLLAIGLVSFAAQGAPTAINLDANQTVGHVQFDGANAWTLSTGNASALTLQTALGSAQMAITADVAPAELRRRVTSPAGTTEQAVKVFDQAELSVIFERALRACADRGAQMALELGAAD